MKQIAYFLVAIAVLAGVWYFLSSDATVPLPGAETGTVTGYVHIGPTCPVVQVGREEECQDRPYAVSIEIHYLNEKLLKIIRSGEDGKFSVDLAAGEYIFRPQLANVLPACNEERVTVVANQTTSVDISCDSGIR